MGDDRLCLGGSSLHGDAFTAERPALGRRFDRELRRFDGVIRPDDRRVMRNKSQPTLPFGGVVVN
jgi:hypothetical protein